MLQKESVAKVVNKVNYLHTTEGIFLFIFCKNATNQTRIRQYLKKDIFYEKK